MSTLISEQGGCGLWSTQKISIPISVDLFHAFMKPRTEKSMSMGEFRDISRKDKAQQNVWVVKDKRLPLFHVISKASSFGLILETKTLRIATSSHGSSTRRPTPRLHCCPAASIPLYRTYL